MLVHVTRSGGFAGLTAEATLDTDELAPGVGAALADVCAAAAAKRPAPGHGADRFQYAIRLPDGSTAYLPEERLPEQVRTAINQRLGAGGPG